MTWQNYRDKAICDFLDYVSQEILPSVAQIVKRKAFFACRWDEVNGYEED